MDMKKTNTLLRDSCGTAFHHDPSPLIFSTFLIKHMSSTF